MDGPVIRNLHAKKLLLSENDDDDDDDNVLLIDVMIFLIFIVNLSGQQLEHFGVFANQTDVFSCVIHTVDGRFVTATRSILLIKIKISCSSFSAVLQSITVTLLLLL